MSGPVVSIIMGSSSDHGTMDHAARVLEELGILFEIEVVSAHRTPERMLQFAAQAESRGIRVIIAGAGGAAHLPGMTAARSMLPVIGVPIQLAALQGMDSLLSIVQMPRGVPVATMAIGSAGAANAALMAARILAGSDPDLHARLRAFGHRDA